MTVPRSDLYGICVRFKHADSDRNRIASTSKSGRAFSAHHALEERGLEQSIEFGIRCSEVHRKLAGARRRCRWPQEPTSHHPSRSSCDRRTAAFSSDETVAAANVSPVAMVRSNSHAMLKVHRVPGTLQTLAHGIVIGDRSGLRPESASSWSGCPSGRECSTGARSRPTSSHPSSAPLVSRLGANPSRTSSACFTASVLPKTMVEGSTKHSTIPVLPIG